MQILKKSAKPWTGARLFILALILGAISPCGRILAADDTLINIAPAPAEGLRPGMLIILPDGRRTAIQSILPDGNYITESGVTISPAGVITDGPLKGEQVILPKNAILPDEAAKVDEPERPRQDSAGPEVVQIPQVAEKPQQEQIPDKAPIRENQKPVAPAEGAGREPAQPHELTIVELLPMTTLPGTQKAPEPARRQEESQGKHPAKAQEKTAPAKAPEKKQLPKAQAAPNKARPGQELRIPPEAAKTGNLDFLEGCWQGTRPEYISKRTIRECFCFGANGKNGKRRVYDPMGKRMCIGASSASLSAAGVLSVTSSGAACNDGERWGQAEMVCKNSGPSTPCSWVFRDAQNGRQSYTIPFVRVETCGR